MLCKVSVGAGEKIESLEPLVSVVMIRDGVSLESCSNSRFSSAPAKHSPVRRFLGLLNVGSAKDLVGADEDFESSSRSRQCRLARHRGDARIRDFRRRRRNNRVPARLFLRPILNVGASSGAWLAQHRWHRRPGLIIA